jgi:hypothetical protein
MVELNTNRIRFIVGDMLNSCACLGTSAKVAHTHLRPVLPVAIVCVQGVTCSGAEVWAEEE